MRLISILLTSAAVAGLVDAQGRGKPAGPREIGAQAPKWSGRIDPDAERRGAKLTDTKLSGTDDGLHVVSGPGAIYWSEENMAVGSYVVRATFAQAKVSRDGGHYGLVVGGSQLVKGEQNYLYCAISGDGTFMVRHRLGGELHQLAGLTRHVALRRANAEGKASNVMALRVTPVRTSCLVNGAEVWGYASTSLVGVGKLASLDGMAGIRVDGNVDVHVNGFAIARP
jgi:hypothetical protein